ncbi:hypothetical protein [Mitsuaria sp. GD03876]|uniref:hypothetical protein n=1 Tax=Mitsuaria sp. GD03876 TaxID=2975399 RepID=UPI00244B451C|nr:hypothetical protein [Mitsuaria sp. GD03876]MDH0866067.1 hypothetical protein [Mitsuaria sp. GD03876]
MSRFAAEFQRLYAAGPEGSARALVLDVGRPSDWDLMGAVWRGVQLELSLPAPGIAIAGENSYQLWFSLERGVAPDEAKAFFDGIQARFLAGVAASRIRWLTAIPEVPAEVREDQWSAFVAPDLAPVFVEATWLDIPPGLEGQADLLKGLKRITPSAWEVALEQLAASKPTASATPVAASSGPSTSPASTPEAPAVFAPATRFTDPREFLLQVMNDASVPMALRIEAAKGLLSSGGVNRTEG